LAKRDEIAVGGFVEPAPAFDEFAAKVAQMSNRAAERGQPKFEKNGKHFERAVAARGRSGADGKRFNG